MSTIEAKKQKILKKKYFHEEIELKWQSVWENDAIYQPDLANAKRPFFNLMMFPYPSAEGLHVGSVYAFGGADVYSRFKRMQGKDVFEPIGLDGFGIHSENHAIKTNTHPMEHAKTTEENFYRQLHEIGNGFAWKNKLETYDPHYYKWTQWLFVQLFKAGLAYREKAPVNFCPWCKTVLADEQVIDEKCERCGTIVEKRNLEQWFFRITKYAERLLGNIPELDWSEKVKIAQTNWIGKKTGINITYAIKDTNEVVEVFTTRPDTNFGATFVAIAPEHEFVNLILDGKLKASSTTVKAIKKYINLVKNKSQIERTAEGKEKTGVFTGYYAINQLTGYHMPIWISDFVLTGFGTGALVGVPAHDKRDFEFAQKFDLEIKRVVVGKDGDTSSVTKIEQVQEDEGSMVNSDFLNGMDIHDATEKIMDHIEEKGYGKRVVNYHLRDWLISRQRYWGPPIPMIYCKSCAEDGKSWFTTDAAKKEKIENRKLKIENSALEKAVGWYPVEDSELPVKLPFVEDYKPLGTGKSPLGNYPEFYEVACPECGGQATRETDVSDTFLDSAWYFFRYPSVDRDDVAFARDIAKKWLPVHMYIGGAEHSVLHLLYSRFVTMVIHDLGYIDFEEPFARFYAHGLIIKDGVKMSKSKGNVINPDLYIRKFGADTLRTYLMFLGPFNQGGDFRDTGIEGMNRFLKRVWTMFAGQSFVGGDMDEAAKTMYHKTVKGVTEDFEALRYNTVIAKVMTYYNFLAKQPRISQQEAAALLQMLAPFAPHMTEELWEMIGNDYSIHTSHWPSFDESGIVERQVTIALQVNGRLRGTLEVSADEAGDKEKIEALAQKNEKLINFLTGQKVRKIIFVPGKIVNFVVA